VIKRQCLTEVKIEGMPGTTFFCCLGSGHDGPHEIGVLGSDALCEALDLTNASPQA